MAKRVPTQRPSGRSESWLAGPLLACACGLVLPLASCTGGPHPLPPVPGSETTFGLPTSAPSLAAGSPTGPIVSPATLPVPMPVMMRGGDTAPSPPFAPSGAAGMGATAAAAGSGASLPAAAAPPAGNAATAGASAPAMPGNPACQSQTFVPRSADAAPDGVLFLVDRSAAMASDFQGQPRWQMSGHALVAALTPLADKALRVGALFYPSTGGSAPGCLGPAWLCAPVAGTGSVPASSCAVTGLAAADQLAFQPAKQALAELNASSDLYASIAGDGVPLRESIDRADAELANLAPQGRSTVVLVVNAQPSCRWDATQSAATVSAWRTQRHIPTRVIALPGAGEPAVRALSGLAQAGGGTRVLTPGSEVALQSALQSIVMGALNSCTLTFNPAVSMPNDAHLIVGVNGIEQEIRRSADSGAAQWTLNDAGTQLNLLGKLCSSALAGEYDSLRLAVGCVRYPIAAP
jgi:hypothetical protein